MCRMMAVHPSGYYAWRAEPVSARQKEDQRLTGLIKQFWLESGGVYGYRKITDDLRDVGEFCGKHRVYRLMKSEALRSQTGYRRRPGQRYGRPAVVAPNHVQQQFNVAEPNRVWVTDITYIRTHEGWLYLAAVLDLFSRQVIGWSMQSRMDRELAINALLMAVWRRQPKQAVIVDAVLWRPLPYPASNDVISLGEQRPRENRIHGPVAPAGHARQFFGTTVMTVPPTPVRMAPSGR